MNKHIFFVTCRDVEQESSFSTNGKPVESVEERNDERVRKIWGG